MIRRIAQARSRITKMELVSTVLIQPAPGTTKTAANAISKMKGVKMAHAVPGPFDVIPCVEVPDLTTRYRT